VGPIISTSLIALLPSFLAPSTLLAQAPAGAAASAPVPSESVAPTGPSPTTSPAGQAAPPASYGAPYWYGGPYVPPVPPPGIHTHDGVYVRLQAGMSYERLTIEAAGVRGTIQGPGLCLNVALGGAVTENLVLYGELFTALAVDPGLTVSPSQQDVAVIDEMTFRGIGPGIVYYFGATNAFLTTTLMLAKAEARAVSPSLPSTSAYKAESRWGWAIEAQLGKEWWVSDNWGVGVALAGFFGRMKDRSSTVAGEVPMVTTSAASLLFSATYN
jgi:hypothetical protein